MTTLTRFLVSLVVTLFLGVVPVEFQREKGAIEGKISDQWGAVADASITLRNTMSGDVWRSKSDAEGFFNVPGLPRGRYSLWVEAAEHESFWAMKVLVEGGSTTRQDVFLKKRRWTQLEP